MKYKKRARSVLATLAICSFVIAACSSDKKSSSTEAPAGSSATPSAGSAAGSTPAGGGNDLANFVPPETAGGPVHGGTLTFGIDSDSANPWAPYRTSCAGSCFIILASISDSLFALDPNGKPVPLLLKGFDHNADYTQWVFHVRDGIKFQDGTPLDGDAVKFNIDSCLDSPLTASAYAAIDNVTASGQDVTINTKGGPWVALPSYFGYGQCGYMMSKQWLSSLSDIPQRNPKAPRYDATLAATPATGDPAKPVGLGAFKYESYTPGNGNSFKATRNPDYWRGKNGITGEDLPYLDGIEAVVYVDIDSRQNAVRAGDIDAMNTANADAVKNLLADKSLKTTTTNKFGETGYILLNVASGANDPEGKNAKSPLLQLPCRQALAASIDTARWAKERGGGIETPANGPFGPAAVGYLADSGYPKFDKAQANVYMDACLKAMGSDHIEFTYNTTNDPFNVESNQLVISMWQDAFGDKVKATITPVEQGQYIGLALTGDYQAFGWRNHSGSDPDQQRTWWASTAAKPIGTSAVNFGRFQDPVIDKALDTIKTNGDPAARKSAAEDINREFGAQVWNLWLTQAISGVTTQPYVNGVMDNKLPDGGQGVGLEGQQRQQTNQLWCDNGKCE
jgi:peptide/nickel transport system substrate-binding protein